MWWRNRAGIVHETRDGLGAIQVVDYRKHRVLLFDSVFEQSKIHRRQPQLPVHEYNRAMLLPLAFSQPRRATILGLGGGVLVGALHRLLPACELQAVELRDEVVSVAREFFSLPDSDRVRIIVGDARGFVESATAGSTDLILADLYNADRMSLAQTRHQFISDCARLLGPDGWLAINYHRPPDHDGPLFRQLRGRFGSLFLYQSKTNNTVIYASKRAIDPGSPDASHLDTLQKQLPIDWHGLTGQLVRLR